MKSVTKLFSIFFFAILSNFATNAQGTITWALTANGSASTSTGLTTFPLTLGSGINLPSSPTNPYSASGVTAINWNKSTSISTNEYYEYSVQTNSTQTWTVSGISFTHSFSSGSWNYAVYWSKDNFTNTNLYSVSASESVPSGTNSVSISGTGKNIPMGVNTKLQFRVYAWSNSGSSPTYSNLNFVITGTTPAALPVTLSNFTAKQTTDNSVSLAWVTSSESVNKGFSIERQEEGSAKFQSLGFIPSKAENGNSQAAIAYSFKDMAAKKGTNMYRLVQEDLDGTKTYSEVRVVKLSEQSVSNVFPNPSNGSINISRSNDGKKMNIQVLDQAGRVISQVNNIIDSNYRMNLPQPGIYSIKMMYPETGEQSIQRIVVQK